MRTHQQPAQTNSPARQLPIRQELAGAGVERPSERVEPSSAAQFGHRLGDIAATPPGGALRVGPAGDQYEQEADRVAERIVAEAQTPGAGTAEPTRVTPLANPGGNGSVQREASHEGPASSASGGPVAPALATRIHEARDRGGEPLPATLRAPAERVLRTNLSGVRLHHDQSSQLLTRAVGADAFATGQDIFLGPGAANASSPLGLAMLAHEVTHTVQQADHAAGNNDGVIQRIWPFDQIKKWWNDRRARRGNQGGQYGNLPGPAPILQNGAQGQYAPAPSAADLAGNAGGQNYGLAPAHPQYAPAPHISSSSSAQSNYQPASNGIYSSFLPNRAIPGQAAPVTNQYHAPNPDVDNVYGQLSLSETSQSQYGQPAGQNPEESVYGDLVLSPPTQAGAEQLGPPNCDTQPAGSSQNSNYDSVNSSLGLGPPQYHAPPAASPNLQPPPKPNKEGKKNLLKKYDK